MHPTAEHSTTAHPITRTAVIAAVRAGLSPLRPLPPLTLSQFAAKHFYLSKEASHTTGQWTPDPPQIGIMDFLSHDDIEELNVRKAKRMGWTKILCADYAFNAAYRRRIQIMYQPTDDDRDSFVKTEIEPVHRDVKIMSTVAISGKGVEDTMKLKMFLGSVAHFLGAKAARAFRRITGANVKLDEVDAMDPVVENSIDPVEGARGRLEGAAFPKLALGTTPRVKGISHIERREKAAGARLRYTITCPSCAADHPIIQGDKDLPYGFKWHPGDFDSAHHVCPHCKYELTQPEFLRIWGAGYWHDKDTGLRYDHGARLFFDAANNKTRPPAHVAVVDWWAAYSPRRAWPSIAKEKHEAAVALKAGQDGPMQTYVNETEARVWEVKFEQADEHTLSRRAEDYRLRTVPMGGLVLVAGVDMQDTWWEIVVWAIGRGEEMWVVDHTKIIGNPGDMAEWEEKLDPYFSSVFPHESGSQLRIEAVALDTMGHFTHQAYNYCRLREKKKFYAVRGDPTEGKPIGGRATTQDVNWRGQILKRGVKLWYVGVDTAADTFHARLQVKSPGPGFVHFSKDLAPTFFTGLTAEKRVPFKTSKGIVYRWANVDRLRNEPSDCTRYAMFCAVRLNLNTYTDAMWARLERLVQAPKNGDLFVNAPTPDAPLASLIQPTPPKPTARPAQPRPAHSTPRVW